MATPIQMPRQGNTVESCVIQEWHKNKGDTVKEGDILFTYETDKASFEFEAPVSGVLLETFFGVDDDVPVLTTVGVIGESGESVDEFRPSLDVPEAKATEEKTVENAPSEQGHKESPVSEPPLLSKQAPSGELAGVSPRARNLAKKNGIAVSTLAGTGPKGRIIERDVRASMEKGPRFTSSVKAAMEDKSITVSKQSGTGFGGRIRLADLSATDETTGSSSMAIEDTVKEVRLSTMRKIIGTRMMESLQQTAQLTMHASADATGILAYRKMVKKNRETMNLADITITDLVAFAVSRVLVRFPQMNALFKDDVIVQYNHIHLAMAVDTPRGLMVPVVRFADLLSLNDLALGLKKAASECQEGTINPDQLQGGTFTISNLGQFGIEYFTPVLNPPQVGLLGVNTIQPRPVMDAEGECTMVPHIGLSLTMDHRALDGADAARFLQEVVSAIKNVTLTLAV